MKTPPVTRSTMACPGPASKLARREVTLPVTAETFDLYVRSVAQIAAETGLSHELTVEVLMAYSLALPEADELIHGFIRGDLTLFPSADENRRIMERDTRRLELEALASESRATTPLGRKLEPGRKIQSGTGHPERESGLDAFIRDNPEVHRQVRSSSHEFLTRWVMLYLMEAAQARERVHRIAHEFWAQFPEHRQRIESAASKLGRRPVRRISAPNV